MTQPWDHKFWQNQAVKWGYTFREGAKPPADRLLRALHFVNYQSHFFGVVTAFSFESWAILTDQLNSREESSNDFNMWCYNLSDEKFQYQHKFKYMQDMNIMSVTRPQRPYRGKPRPIGYRNEVYLLMCCCRLPGCNSWLADDHAMSIQRLMQEWCIYRVFSICIHVVAISGQKRLVQPFTVILNEQQSALDTGARPCIEGWHE